MKVPSFEEYELPVSVQVIEKRPPLLLGDHENGKGNAARSEAISDAGSEPEAEAEGTTVEIKPADEVSVMFFSDALEDSEYGNVDILRRSMNSDRIAAV